MTDELIRQIVQREQELANELADEERRAQAWLDGVRAELATQQEARCQQRRQQQAEARDTALARAREQTRERLTRADAWASRLAALDEACLRPLLLQRLAAILPAGDHDHPDG